MFTPAVRNAFCMKRTKKNQNKKVIVYRSLCIGQDDKCSPQCTLLCRQTELPPLPCLQHAAVAAPRQRPHSVRL